MTLGIQEKNNVKQQTVHIRIMFSVIFSPQQCFHDSDNAMVALEGPLKAIRFNPPSLEELGRLHSRGMIVPSNQPEFQSQLGHFLVEPLWAWNLY